jgi:branched-chain amino acid transport system permease protein
MASAMGVDFRITLPLAFGLAGLLGGVAGALVAPIVFPQFQMGQAVLVKAFAASVIGGLDSIAGAIVGGLLIGLIESLVGAYVTSTYSDLMAFLLLIVVLIARPTGVLGRRRFEKV